MANKENLVPLTTEKAREIGRKGGIASGKAKKQRKTLREELLLLLANGNTQKNISVALINEALNGNVKAFETIRDSIGEKPVEQIESNVQVNQKFNDICSQLGGEELDE